MSRSLLGLISSWVAIGLLGCAQSAPAVDSPSADSQAMAKKVLGEWYASFSAAKSYTAQVDGAVSITQEGKVVESDETSYRVAFERPQRFALTLLKGEGISVVNGEKNLYEYLSAKKQYVAHEAPAATAAEAAGSRLVQFVNFGQGLGPIGAALAAPTFEQFFAGYESPAFLGTEEKDGVKTQHLRVVKKGMPIDLWFSADSKQLLRIAPDIKTGLTQQGQTLPPGVEFVMTINFLQAAYDAPLAADAFAFVPPTGVELVDDLFAQPPHALLGKQAPTFETTALDGAAIKSADLTGKVVVLDFWATWCGPCVKALPAISATAAKYKDKGVTFYAVNQQEEASIIKEFLAAQKLAVPVALDLEGKIGTLFAVEGIPQTVIIDKQGKVQVVHVGAGDDIGTQLAKELDAVLAGKELADEKLKKKK